MNDEDMETYINKTREDFLNSSEEQKIFITNLSKLNFPIIDTIRRMKNINKDLANKVLIATITGNISCITDNTEEALQILDDVKKQIIDIDKVIVKSD